MLKTTTRVAVLLAGLSLLLAGCNDKEIAEERAKIELAETKGDLDQMFLSLKKLSSLGDKEADVRLPHVTEAIRAREDMRLAASDHNHEAVIASADKLLAIMPQDNDAIRALRESGQIFWLLRNAQTQLASLPDDTSQTELRSAQAPNDLDVKGVARWRIITTQAALRDLGKTISDSEGDLGSSTEKAIKEEVPDYKPGRLTEDVVTKIVKASNDKVKSNAEAALMETRFAALARARDLVAKARLLDPQFRGALQVEELLDQAHSGLVYLAANAIVMKGSITVIVASSFHSKIIDILNTAATSRYGSVSQAWKSVAPITDGYRDDVRRGALAHIERAAKNLAGYRSGSALPLAEQAQKYAVFVNNAVDRLLNPVGSLIDFRRAGVEVAEQNALLSDQLRAAMPRTVEAQGFLKATQQVIGFSLFRDLNTSAILDKNEKLFSL